LGTQTVQTVHATAALKLWSFSAWLTSSEGAAGRRPRMGKPKTLSDSDVTEVIAEACSFLGGSGMWNQFLEHMEDAGWSEGEVDQAWESFGKRAGRDI
jgi:hypothetical protein